MVISNIMYYAPHIINKRIVTKERDEYQRPIKSEEQWVEAGSCRCDDAGGQEIIDDNGNAFVPLYHIVCSRDIELSYGDYIRIEPKGVEGKVRKSPQRLNFLDYSEVWV